MKKAMTVCLTGVALAATLSLVGAGSFKRSTANGTETRPVDDSAIASERAPIMAYEVSYAGVARIIHIPQSDERASVSNRDEHEAVGTNDDASIAPPPHRRGKPRWPSRSEAPLPRRAVLSAPPPLAEEPTPISPTPRFGAKIGPADKFNTPVRAAPAPNVSPQSADDALSADLLSGN